MPILPVNICVKGKMTHKSKYYPKLERMLAFFWGLNFIGKKYILSDLQSMLLFSSRTIASIPPPDMLTLFCTFSFLHIGIPVPFLIFDMWDESTHSVTHAAIFAQTHFLHPLSLFCTNLSVYIPSVSAGGSQHTI